MSSNFYSIIRAHKPLKKEVNKLLYVHHDQLNLAPFPKAWLKGPTKPTLLFIESAAKASQRPYHKKKLVYVLSCMRHAALEAAKAGYTVIYRFTENDYQEELLSIAQNYPNAVFHFLRPTEWDSRRQIEQVAQSLRDRAIVQDNPFFLSKPEEWAQKIRAGYRMEFFYREMRKRTNFLMQNDQPIGGSWNYDQQNRKKLPKKYCTKKPIAFTCDSITQECVNLVETRYAHHYGTVKGFDFAINRKQALEALDDFILHRLPEFGAYEDAMATGEDEINHSVLSLYINNGLLSPLEVCQKIEQAFHNSDDIPISSAEGIIRQIIGWREYIRNYYEAMMPDLHQLNHFSFNKSLPEAFWTASSKMHCVNECVRPVVEKGYAHHIQRLMVLSNFANLVECDPLKLNEWFWFAFVDAYDWVTTPNVIGMSTFADGGILASKPYVSSGSYINRMSNYCSSCAYNVKEKLGEKACPFNYLYWNFVAKHQDVFSQNGRVGFMVNTYNKKSSDEKEEIRLQSQEFIDKLERKEY